MQRRLLLQLLTAGLLTPLGAIRLALSEEASPTQGIRKMSGSVSIDGKPAEYGMLIKSGSTVSTAAGADAVYVVGNDAFLQRGGSTVKFETADTLRVVTGRILSVFAKGDRRIATPTATIGIRGTGCYIEASEERVYFCLCYGRADLVPLADPQRVEQLQTRHHDRPLYIHRGSAMPSRVPTDVINHHDAELVLLEALVGRTPPFSANKDYLAH